MKNNNIWFFTFPAKDGIPRFDPQFMYYMVFGFEISSTGYHHYQGYVELRKEMKYTDLYPIIGAKCYFAVRRGSKIQAINYALKDLNGIEFGTLTAQGQRVDIEQVRIDIENGKSQKILPKKILVNGVVIIRLLLYMLQWLKNMRHVNVKLKLFMDRLVLVSQHLR